MLLRENITKTKEYIKELLDTNREDIIKEAKEEMEL